MKVTFKYNHKLYGTEAIICNIPFKELLGQKAGYDIYKTIRHYWPSGNKLATCKNIQGISLYAVKDKVCYLIATDRPEATVFNNVNSVKDSDFLKYIYDIDNAVGISK